MQVLLLLVTLTAAARAASLDCKYILMTNGLSKNFNETIGHAIHSMTVQGLRIFSQHASVLNNIPTVDHRLTLGDGNKAVLPNAPDDPVGSDFKTLTMNTIDKILSNLGQPTDGLGENWSSIERVVHTFHMMDLWTRINDVYITMVDSPPSENVCRCLLDTKSNGIHKAVEWVAQHYKTGTPITLLNRPIPKLEDAKSWSIWKMRLLNYYTQPALEDAATYLHCVTAGME